MVIMMQRDVVPLGYSIETVWGTDPATTRLAFLGVMRSAKLTIKENTQSYRGIGAGLKPKGFLRKKREVVLDMEYLVQDDKPTNSILGLALGSAPDAVTGIITLYPNAANPNLRSFTVECGSTGRFYQVKGCRIKKLQMVYNDSELVFKISAVAKDFSLTETPAVAPPSLSTLAPFDCYSDGMATFTNPTIAGQIVDNLILTIDNNLVEGSQIGGGRTIGYLQIGGRKVFIGFDNIITDIALENIIYTDPATAAGNVDIAMIVSKNAGVEYIRASLTDCTPLSEGGYDFKDEDTEQRRTYNFEAKDYEFDVKV